MKPETHSTDEQLPGELAGLAEQIRLWGQQLGFQQVGITDISLQKAENHLKHWLSMNHHGEMEYMSRHGLKRSRPDELISGTTRIISVRMDYLPHEAGTAVDQLKKLDRAYISRYALGRDYHKVMRSRLQKLVRRIEAELEGFNYRVFTDSAPVLEKALAEKAGLGWIGKHSNLINRKAGSWFFLGEIYTDLPLPVDSAVEEHCGSCQTCIEICPTRAIIAPYQVDARLCISYLTIEYKGVIEEQLRPLLGNRIYGCDDCQLCCPWNRFGNPSKEADFQPRHGLDDTALLNLFSWSESEFMKNMEGSPIRRIGYQSWQRNITIALGNAAYDPDIVKALEIKQISASELVREHISWAIKQQKSRTC
ncbi:MAG: tRNA epoxyqueuosine(34) reductase QueG [Arenicellales bacterium]